jgi:hypothetical protein
MAKTTSKGTQARPGDTLVNRGKNCRITRTGAALFSKPIGEKLRKDDVTKEEDVGYPTKLLKQVLGHVGNDIILGCEHLSSVAFTCQ